MWIVTSSFAMPEALHRIRFRLILTTLQWSGTLVCSGTNAFFIYFNRGSATPWKYPFTFMMACYQDIHRQGQDMSCPCLWGYPYKFYETRRLFSFAKEIKGVIKYIYKKSLLPANPVHFKRSVNLINFNVFNLFNNDDNP